MLACVAQAFSRSKAREGDTLPEREPESIVVVEGPTPRTDMHAHIIVSRKDRSNDD